MGVYDLNYASTDPNSMATRNYFQAPNTAQTSTSLVPTAPTGVTAPGMTNTASTGLGMNLGTGQLVLGSIGTIGNLWAAFQAQKLAKEQFQFQKGVTNTNLANQIQSYNTSLTDKINSRTAQEGGDTSQAQAYVDNNKLVDERKNK